MTVNRVPQSFKMKLSELTPEQRAQLQLWIKLVWRDKLQTEDDHDDHVVARERLTFNRGPNEPGVVLFQRPTSESERGKMTLDRMESIVQTTIWRSLIRNTAESFP
jgi:hypothetical protein